MRALELDRLLGRRYTTDFRVISIGDRPSGGTDDDREVVLHHLGDRTVISLGELLALIETGFVVESVRP